MAGLLSKLLSRGADRQLKEFEKIATAEELQNPVTGNRKSA